MIDQIDTFCQSSEQMYRVANGEGQMVLLDTTEALTSNAKTCIMTQSLIVNTCLPQSQSEAHKSRNKTKTSSLSMPSTETAPPDIILHSNGCAIALHLSVLKSRCPWFYKQLRKFRDSSHPPTGLKLLDDEDLLKLKDKPKDSSKCPLHDTQALKLDYVRCRTHVCRDGQSSDDDDITGGHALQKSPVILPRRKRLRHDVESAENQTQNGQRTVHKPRRPACFIHELNPATLARLDKILQYQRSLMHVEIAGSTIEAIVTNVEYIYRCEVRMIGERNAMEVVKLGQSLGVRCTMLYYCLVIAIRHVTTATWMEMLLAASTLENEMERHHLCNLLLAFLQSLKPEQYFQVLKDMRCTHLKRLKDHDVLVCVVIGLINNIRLVEYWQNLRDALSQWLSNRFHAEQAPSLCHMHRHFAPEWTPYMEQGPVELYTKPGEGNLLTLLRFGKFQLQLRIDITDEMLILWRIIRSSSPQLLSSDPDVLNDPASLDTDPQFCIRGHMKFKYWRAQPNRAEIEQEVVIQYQHCYKQYSKWCNLVPPTPSTSAPAVTAAAAVQSEYLGKAQFCGKLFVWGDPVCSMYHFLLQTTLFYSAPHNTPTEVSDLIIISEMQRLPLETLELVLRSDGLHIPDGERTLLRCLNKLFFGNHFSYLGRTHQEPQAYNVCAYDMIRLYKCVRWSFVPLDDIIATLRRSPRELEFYELIENGLQDTFQRFHRRRPWRWRKQRHAYMKNEATVVEFRIEARKNHLSPEYFPTDTKIEISSQDSIHLSPAIVYGDTSRIQSVYIDTCGLSEA